MQKNKVIPNKANWSPNWKNETFQVQSVKWTILLLVGQICAILWYNHVNIGKDAKSGKMRLILYRSIIKLGGGGGGILKFFYFGGISICPYPASRASISSLPSLFDVFLSVGFARKYSRRSQSIRAKAYGSVLFSASNLNLFMGFCRKDIWIRTDWLSIMKPTFERFMEWNACLLHRFERFT